MSKFRNDFKLNSNENTTHYNLQSTDKTLLRGEFLALTFILEKNKDLKPFTSGSISGAKKEKNKNNSKVSRMKELTKEHKSVK